MKIRRTKDVSWRIVEDEGVILHFRTGAYYSLNEIGLRIWELCDGKNSTQEIQSILASEYDGGEGKMGKEVDHFLTQLHREKLIEIVS